MSPESFNRLNNTSKEEFDRFVDWLFSHALAELRSARGSMETTKAAWIRYFQRGLKAELLFDELMHYLPELFTRAQYSSEEAGEVLEMLKHMNFGDVGINRTNEGVRFE
jgi:hypothetical protein